VKPKSDDMVLRILSLGAGVQSTALLLMSCKGILPKLDAAVFADTQWESGATYRHLEWLEQQAAHAGIPLARVSAGSLREHTMNSQVRGRADGKRPRCASIPLRVISPEGTRGMIKRQCTREYKIEPIQKFVRRELLSLKPRQRIPAGTIVDRWLGISTDEMRRARMRGERWERLVYPLLNLPEAMLDRGYSRLMCVDWIKANYPGVDVPRSSCIGCPFHGNAEWRAVKAVPEEWADVIAVDRAVRSMDKLNGAAYLHGDYLPLERANLDEEQASMWGEECLGVCNT
jgi:hypothetical protein